MFESGWSRDEQRATPEVQAVTTWQLCAQRAGRICRPVESKKLIGLLAYLALTGPARSS